MDGNEEARQWFGIPKNFKDVWFTIPPEKLGKKPLKKLTRMYNWYNSAALKVIEFIRERMDFHKIGAQDTYIFGVSQGAMMAVQMIAESDLLADWSSEGTLIPLGGVMIIAGCLINAAEVEAHPSLARPEFIFVHGSEDTTVPFRAYLLTDKTLLKCGQKPFQKSSGGKTIRFLKKKRWTKSCGWQSPGATDTYNHKGFVNPKPFDIFRRQKTVFQHQHIMPDPFKKNVIVVLNGFPCQF